MSVVRTADTDDVAELRRIILEQRLRILFLERDMLTELLGRHVLERLLPAEFSKAQRAHRPLAVIALDVDYFKRVNDTQGHAVGDAVLQAVAHSIQGAVRASDYVFRPGGEEFLVLLAETTADEAERVAERILGEVRNRTGVTVSAGVAAYPDHGTTPEELLRRADVALYESKKAGRDRLTVPWAAP